MSLLWAFGDEQTAREVRRAHDAAVAAAVGFVEAEVARSRRGRNGVEPVEVSGVVAAAFRHRTSRAKDPLLHTHVLVANAVKGVDDGTWRTLDSRRLCRWAKTAGYLYQSQLRHELTVRLGVAWGPVTNGCADIAGLPREVIEAFSTRRAQILAALDERGEDSARAAQVAALATRTPKTADAERTRLARVWRERALEVGFGHAELLRQYRAAPFPVYELDGDWDGPCAIGGHAGHRRRLHSVTLNYFRDGDRTPALSITTSRLRSQPDDPDAASSREALDRLPRHEIDRQRSMSDDPPNADSDPLESGATFELTVNGNPSGAIRFETNAGWLAAVATRQAVVVIRAEEVPLQQAPLLATSDLTRYLHDNPE